MENLTFSKGNLLKFKVSIRMRKKAGLSVFECGVFVGGRQAGLNICETAGIFPTQLSGVYKEWSEQEKTSSKWQCSQGKCFVDTRG